MVGMLCMFQWWVCPLWCVLCGVMGIDLHACCEMGVSLYSYCKVGVVHYIHFMWFGLCDGCGLSVLSNT